MATYDMLMGAYLIFTVLTSILLIILLPTIFIWAIMKWVWKHNLTPLFRFLYIAGGLAIGLALAWTFVVFHEGWPLSCTETIKASYQSDLYSHEIEGAAEDYLLFTLFFGNIGAILAGFIGWFTSLRRHRRLALSN